jgi:hypothetical protein
MKYCLCVLAVALGLSLQPRDAASCQSDIVSATVVATFCGHALNQSELLDLVILWRGRAGWFQHREDGGRGEGGSWLFGAGTKGHVTQHSTYSGVTIGFDADFDAGTVTIGDIVVSLQKVNTIFVDRVDAPAARRISATRWTEPHLPLAGDRNLLLARRSRLLRDYLQCEVPMPAPPRWSRGGNQIPQPAVITVCEKLRRNSG